VAEPRGGTGNKPPIIPGQNGDPKTKAEALEKLKNPKITPEDRKKYSELMDNLKS
jgi:hypothetical protein